jgi:hypothetical protein
VKRLTEYKRWIEAIGLTLSGAALLAVAGCGGGGDAGAATPSVAPAATTSAPGSSAPSGLSPTSGAPTLADCDMFPANAIFNTRIDDTAKFPADANSGAWLDRVGRSVSFSADWGNDADPSHTLTYFGMPINVVGGSASTTDWPVVSFDFAPSGMSIAQGYPDRSDCAVANASGGFDIARNCASVAPAQRRFPFPAAGKTLSQGGNCNDPASCGDHPVLVVEKGACRLWESYFAFDLSNQWYAMATAAWDLKSLALRPNGWGAASASGLPITPLLAKAAEASSGEVRHALRVNFNGAQLAQQARWPARFATGWGGADAIPFGALLRLRADFAIPDDWTPQAKALATAAKRYGLYVADNGPDFYVQGEPNAAWDLRTSAQMKTITMGDMEFVDLSSITGNARFDIDSMAASW